MSIKTVKIQCDGNPHTMRVTDTETGQDMQVTSVNLSMNASERYPDVTLTVALPALDLIADAEIKHVCPCCGRDVEGVPS